MIFSKKGAIDLHSNLLVGIIMGMVVLIAFIVPATSIASNYLDSKAGIEDMKLFIEELEDETSGELRLNFPDEYILLSFYNGADFGEDRGVTEMAWFCPEEIGLNAYRWQINFPEEDEACIDGNCVCACKKSIFSSVPGPDACSFYTTTCISFDTEYTPRFIDPDCDWGVFRESTSSDVLTLSMFRKDDFIYICEEENCIPEEDQEAYDQFLTFTEDYQECLEQNNDCTCELDFDFLEEEYALNFYSDKITLYKMGSDYELAMEKFTTNYNVEYETDVFNEEMSVSFSTTLTDKLLLVYDFDKTQFLETSETLQKDNNGLTFVDPLLALAEELNFDDSDAEVTITETVSCFEEETTEQEPLIPEE